MADGMTTLPPIKQLTTCSKQDNDAVLSLLFEPSPSLHEICTPILMSNEFASYPEMIGAVGAKLRTLAAESDTSTLDDILASHPRLGEKKVDSALSRAEQAAMAKASAASSDAEKEQATLKQLNAEYEQTFPGLRYVYVANTYFPKSAETV